SGELLRKTRSRPDGARPSPKRSRHSRPTTNACRRAAFLRRTHHRRSVINPWHLTGDYKTRMGFGKALAAPPTKHRRQLITPERWRQVKHLLAEALELDTARQRQFLDSA